MVFFKSKPFELSLSSVALATILSGCMVTGQKDEAISIQTSNAPIQLTSFIPAGRINSEVCQVAAEGILALDEGRLADASKAFNICLNLDLTNSYIHFLNAYTYHLRAKSGEVKHYPLAEQGYARALHFDESNWIAEYYLGLALMDQRKFVAAKEILSRLTAYYDDDPRVLYDLATAAYYARDPEAAQTAMQKLHTLVPDDWNDGKAMAANAVIHAALDNTDIANNYMDQYATQFGDDIYAIRTQRRLMQWEKAHDTGTVELAQAPAFPWETKPGDEEDTSSNNVDILSDSDIDKVENAGFVDQQMAVVDVVIIRTEEDLSTSKGVNLLNGLQLQFGDPDNGLLGLGLSDLKSIDSLDASNSSSVSTFARHIGIPAVNYSLNIANAFSGRNEILARPSLVALAQQTSEFFSGVEVAAAAVSGGNGDSVSIEKEIGVRLAVTPEFLPGDRVKLQVIAERTFLTTPSSSVVFEFRLDTSKTTVNANVAMKFGETLILSGLSEKETESKRDGVPVLQDIPLVQYLFSKATTRDFHKSVLILLTPRRAQYLDRNDKDRKAALARLPEHERKLVEEQLGSQDQFTPEATTEAVFQHMNKNGLYKQFRTGDIPPAHWRESSDHKKRLRSAIEFLYY